MKPAREAGGRAPTSLALSLETIMTMPKDAMECPDCHRIVRLTTTGRIVRHKDPDALGDSTRPYCEMSGTPTSYFTFSPATAAMMGGTEGTSTDTLVEQWRTEELSRWWTGLADAELPGLIAKAHEYSSYDLEMIGKMMSDTLGLEPSPGKGYYEEIGCWFYLLGKVARAMGAIRDGKLPSEDTALDTRIYATMILRIKQAGGWPG
jgi:hypothetical protein